MNDDRSLPEVLDDDAAATQRPEDCGDTDDTWHHEDDEYDMPGEDAKHNSDIKAVSSKVDATSMRKCKLSLIG